MDQSIQDRVSAMQEAEAEAQKHAGDKAEAIKHTRALIKTIGQSVAILVKYLEGKEFVVGVNNFPTSISTPDIEKVCQSLEGLKSDLSRAISDRPSEDARTHELLSDLITAVRNLPTSFPEAADPVTEVTVGNLNDYSPQLKQLLDAVKAIQVEVTPEINVQSPEVIVQSDFTNLENKLDILKRAVESIQLVVPQHDNSEVVESVNAVTKAISGIRFPVPNFTAAFKDRDGVSTSATVNEYGAAYTTTPPMALNIDEGGTIIYIGLAAPGSSESDPVWQLQKLDTAGGLSIKWADGDINFDNVWDDRALLTYS